MNTFETFQRIGVVIWSAAVIAFWVGMVKPALVIRWNGDKSRRAVFKTYGSIGAVLFVIIGATSAKPPSGIQGGQLAARSAKQVDVSQPAAVLNDKPAEAPVAH